MLFFRVVYFHLEEFLFLSLSIFIIPEILFFVKYLFSGFYLSQEIFFSPSLLHIYYNIILTQSQMLVIIGHTFEVCVQLW